MQKSYTHTPLLAEELANDEVLAEAKKTILSRVEAYRQKITQVKPPHPDLKQSYEEILKKMEELRGIPLWYPYIGSGLGNGALVELADGSIKYDFISGIGAHFGHTHPSLIETSLDASIQNTVMQGNLQQNKDSYHLMDLLVKASGLDHCILSTSGAMANENGLKIAFHHKTPAERVLAFENTFMGRTLALSQISDKPSLREGLPSNLFVDYLPFFNPDAPEESEKKALDTLKKYLARYPNSYGCMCMELIQGEAGYYHGSYSFFKTLMQELRDAKIPILVDEVQTFGRTDHLFAFQHFGLEKYADIVTIGKLFQTCATLYKSPFKPKPGIISQTFTSGTVAIRSATVILKTLMKEGFLGEKGKIMQLRAHFVSHLEALATRFPGKIKGPYGYGLMVAFTPFNGEKEKAIALAKALFEEGLICFIAGTDPTRIRFHLPAAEVTNEDIDGASEILQKTLDTF